MRISDWSSDVCSSDLEVVQNMTGTTPSAWNDPTRGSELAQSQFDRGVDVIYAAAGGTGVGVYQTAADSGKFAIGVDSNQNYLHRSEEHTSELQSLMRISYAVFCLQQKKQHTNTSITT